MDKLKGKKIHEMVADGRGKFASMPAGGAAAPVAAAAAVDTKAAPAKKEEKVEEDDNLEGGFDMFGDGYWSHTMVTGLWTRTGMNETGNTMKQGGSISLHR